METESEEEEGGQTSKLQKQGEPEGQPAMADETTTREDLSRCQITRTSLIKHYTALWPADPCKSLDAREC